MCCGDGLLWAIIVYAVVNAVVIPLILSRGSRIGSSPPAPGVLITVAAWVTLVFAAFEFFAARYPEKCSADCGPYRQVVAEFVAAAREGRTTAGKNRAAIATQWLR